MRSRSRCKRVCQTVKEGDVDAKLRNFARCRVRLQCICCQTHVTHHPNPFLCRSKKPYGYSKRERCVKDQVPSHIFASLCCQNFVSPLIFLIGQMQCCKPAKRVMDTRGLFGHMVPDPPAAICDNYVECRLFLRIDSSSASERDTGRLHAQPAAHNLHKDLLH